MEKNTWAVTCLSSYWVELKSCAPSRDVRCAPPGNPTYPTWGKGKLSSSRIPWGYMLVSKRILFFCEGFFSFPYSDVSVSPAPHLEVPSSESVHCYSTTSRNWQNATLFFRKPLLEKLNIMEPEIGPCLKRRFLVELIVFRCHVRFSRCICMMGVDRKWKMIKQGWLFAKVTEWTGGMWR